jgi:hypothetical protein
VLERARLTIVASIGPVCSEALRRHGLPVDLEPEHPKMGHLVVAVAQRGPDLLKAKCAAHERERESGSGRPEGTLCKRSAMRTSGLSSETNAR